MNNLKINEKYNGIDVTAYFDAELNILVGDSGTGKTLLINAIDLYCLNNNIKCRMCNYNDINLTDKQLLTICNDPDVILFDNADLYIRNDIIKELMNKHKIIVMSMKDISSISTSQSEQYLVEYNNLSLSARKM